MNLSLSLSLTFTSSWSPAPTCIQDPYDGTDRMFVSMKNGSILVYTRSTGQLIGTFLEIPNVLDDQEAGLTNLAFHPQFASNKRFFVHYSCILGSPGCEIPCGACGTGFDPECGSNNQCIADHVSVVAEYTVSQDANVANPQEVKRIMTVPQPYRIHNQGSLLFGPDGYLYMTWGDGGNYFDPHNRGQNTTTFLGKAIRIDVDSSPDYGKNYSVPTSNPFYNDPSYWPEIWSIGLRNP